MSETQEASSKESQSAFCMKYAATGNAMAPRMDPRETYRVIATTRMKIARATKMALGNKTQNTPSAVATPLPPLKRSQTGKTWPSTAARAAVASNRWGVARQGQALDFNSSVAMYQATQTATAPLMAS